MSNIKLKNHYWETSGVFDKVQNKTQRELNSEISGKVDSSSMAPTFSAATAYAAGDYVMYEGQLYQFTAAHPEGAWIGTDARAAELASNVAELKSAFDAITEDIECATVTTELNNTYSGVTCVKETAQTIKVYGEGTSTRRLLFLNGQNGVKTSSGEFSKTLDAGTYLIDADMTGAETRYNIEATYTTFSTYVVIAKPEENKKIVTFTAPVMIGFTIMSGRNYGTSESPSYITFSAKRITAKDTIARAVIDESDKIIAKILKPAGYDFSSETEQLWSINASGKWTSWTDLELTRSYVIPCKYADTVSITGNATNGSIIGFLQSFNPTNGASVDFCTGYPSRITIAAEETAKYIIPSDAAYLFLLKTSSGGADYMPGLAFTYSNPYTIYPTNDTTDRTAEVEAKLKQFGICKFEKGRYYVKNVHMPDDSTVIGCGAASEIVLEDDSLVGNLWTDGDQTFVKYYGTTFDTPLPVGRYTFTASVVSNDTDSDKCTVAIYWTSPYTSANGKYIRIDRGTEQTVEFYTSKPIEHIDLFASNTLNNSTGDTATFSDITFTGVPRTAAFITANKCCVRDMTIIGSLTSVTKTTDGLRNGVLFEDPDDTTWRGVISGCFMYNFTGGCICLNDTGGKVYSGYNIDNCYMWGSYAGIDIPIHSEFHRINNCSITGCHYGVLNNGGNNEFTGCNFSANDYGFAVDNSDGTRTNNTHGGMSGCILQHNHTRAVYINQGGSGFVITGCNIDNGGVEIINACRIIFVGCNFMADSPMVISGVYPTDSGVASMIMFNACNMRISENNTYTITDGAIVKFINCYTEDGTAVDPTAP